MEAQRIKRVVRVLGVEKQCISGLRLHSHTSLPAGGKIRIAHILHSSSRNLSK